jgi:homoserine kinase
MNYERSVEVRVPASTANLGAGFDCFGLALRLYLTVRATVVPAAVTSCRMRSVGEGRDKNLPRTAENLIFRAMRVAAERASLQLPPVRLAVHNEIPLGCGLGSSAAAIVAGLTLAPALCGRALPDETSLRYALELEDHSDNVAAALCGGWVTTCARHDGSVLAVKRPWPTDLKIIIVSPHLALMTTTARAVLPRMVALADAVHNLQRVALFGCALQARAYDLLWEAMQDRLHQSHRQQLVPGLADALAMPRRSGLVGLALSGAGPSVLALAHDHFTEIGAELAHNFRQRGITATVRLLEVDIDGRRIRARQRGARRRETITQL